MEKLPIIGRQPWPAIAWGTQVMWPEVMTRRNARLKETVSGTLRGTMCRMCAEASSISRWLWWMPCCTICSMCGRRPRFRIWCWSWWRCGEGYDLLWYKTDLPGVCQISTNWLSNIPKNSEVKESESLFWIRVFELISCCQPHCVGHEMSQVLPLPILREVKVGFAQEICRDTRRSNH